MIYTETRQPGYDVTLVKLFQTDDALALIICQNVFVVGKAWFGEAHDKVTFDIIWNDKFAAYRTFYSFFADDQLVRPVVMLLVPNLMPVMMTRKTKPHFRRRKYF